MANHTVSVSTNYESESRRYTVIFSPNSASLEPGDRLYFRWTSHSGGGEPSHLSVSGFSSSAFTSTSGIQLSDDNSASQFRTVQNYPTEQADSITVSGSSGGSKTFTAQVTTGVDDVPDSFSLGPNKTLANPNSTYSAPYVRITGVTPATAITVAATNGAEISLDGVNFSTASKVGYLDDPVYLRMDAYPYGQTRTTTLSLNNTSDTWSIVTRMDPQNGQMIQFGHASGDVSLTTVASFFGVLNTVDDIRLTSYIRNNNFVPNITENNGIPTSPPISLTDFRNAATSFYFDKFPPNRFMAVNTSGVGTKTYNFAIDVGAQFVMGFGAGMNEGSEYKVQFLERWLTGTNGTRTANSDVTFFGTGRGTYSAAVPGFVVQVTTGETVEKHYQGTVRLWARNRFDKSVEIYADYDYEFFFYS
jgi:hypothetical protein